MVYAEMWHPYCVSDRGDSREPVPSSDDLGRMVGSQRSDQYTPMGEINMVGDFLRALREDRKRKPWIRATLALLVILAAATVLVMAVSAVKSQ